MAAAAAIALAVAGVHQPVALLALAVCAMAVTGIRHEWIRGTRSRHRRGESYPCLLYRSDAAEEGAGGYLGGLRLCTMVTDGVCVILARSVWM